MHIRTTKIISSFGIIIALGVLGLGLYSLWNNKDQVIPQIKGTLEELKVFTTESKFNNLHTEALKASETYYQIGSNWHVEFVGSDDPDEIGQVLVEGKGQSDLVSKNGEGIIFADNKNSESNFARVFSEKIATISVVGPSNVYIRDMSSSSLGLKVRSQGTVSINDSEINQLRITGELKGDIKITDSKIPQLELGLDIVGKIQLPKSVRAMSGTITGTGTILFEDGIDKSELKNTLNLSKFVGDLK